jgi:hypothetical protein
MLTDREAATAARIEDANQTASSITVKPSSGAWRDIANP